MLRISAQSGGLGTSARASLRIRGGQALTVLDPLAAFVASLRAAAPNASGLYLADFYQYSLSQAGHLVDAFGGPLFADAPNNPASPTRVVDPASGLVYLDADGGDDTLIFNAPQTVAAYTFVGRSPQATWSNFGPVLDRVDNVMVGGQAPRLGVLYQGQTTFAEPNLPRRVRRNGVELSPQFSLAPIDQWQVTTVYANTVAALWLQMFAIYGGYFNRLHLAAVLPWPADPNDSEVQATEQGMMSYYSQRYGLPFA